MIEKVLAKNRSEKNGKMKSKTQDNLTILSLDRLYTQSAISGCAAMLIIVAVRNGRKAKLKLIPTAAANGIDLKVDLMKANEDKYATKWMKMALRL